MIRTKTAALAGAGLTLALSLTGCMNETDTPVETPSATPTQTTSQTASASSSAPTTSAAASTSASAASSAAPTFAPVVSERPRDAQAAQIKAFEALELFYEIGHAQLQQNRVDAQLMGMVVREPYLSKRVEAMKPIETSGETYSGESRVELIEPIIGPTRGADGELIDNGNAQLRVCEDNTGVVVRDKDGKRVSSGSVLRYEITYYVTWSEKDGTWKVVTRDVTRDEKGNPKSC